MASVLPFLQNGIAQIALIVPDLERAVAAYWKRFGVGPWHLYTYARPLLKAMTYHGQATEYSFRVALANIGPLRIELIEVGEGDTIYADFVREHGYGLHHLGVLVEDIPAAIAQGEAAGFAMTQDGQGFGLDGDGHYAYLDTERAIGTTIELIARPKRRAPPERIYPFVIKE